MGKKYSVNESFFETWSSTMAYVLGFIYADGSMYISERGSYVVVTSTDKQIIFKIKKWMNSRHHIKVLDSTWKNGKPRYWLRIGNKHLYSSLIQIGMYPNKSLTIRMPKIPRRFVKDFVRGYFDGDGCAYLWLSGGITQKTIVRKLSVIFTSGSKLFLEDLLRLLSMKITVKQTKIYKSQRSFQLRLSTADSIEIFKLMYNNTAPELFFKRKFRVFKNYFQLRPSKIDKKIKSILQYQG